VNGKEVDDEDHPATAVDDVLRLGGGFGRKCLPLAIPVSSVTLKGRLLLIWPHVAHTGFRVEVVSALDPSLRVPQLASTAPPRLIVEVNVTQLSDAQLNSIVTLAMRSQRTFDEVDHADFLNPAPLEEEEVAAILRGNADAAPALRKAIHRAPSSEKKESAKPMKFAAVL
jgi:hypothetical protein